MTAQIFAALILIGSYSVGGLACEEHKDHQAHKHGHKQNTHEHDGHKHDLEKHAAHDQTRSIHTDSLFQLNSAWKSSSGSDVTFESFKDKEVILTMAYTFCQYTCPMTIAKLREIEKQAVKSGRADFSIVVASFDPSRDTPDRLATFIREKKLDPKRWIFLSPKSDQEVRELAAVLGITYSKDSKGEYAHSNIISLLDRDGVIRHQVNGLAADHDEMVKAINAKRGR